ncbi:MAG TPA: hypothetical protein VHS96_08410, partial [Bacteroidia bacterium]|nr:hypothetical protein [Bacteroidia bacterium]
MERLQFVDPRISHDAIPQWIPARTIPRGNLRNAIPSREITPEIVFPFVKGATLNPITRIGVCKRIAKWTPRINPIPAENPSYFGAIELIDNAHRQ